MKCPNCGKRGSGSFCTGCGAQFKVKADKRFWQTGWFAVLALVVFFPLGLYCMWRHTQWGKPIKIVVTALALAWMILCGAVGEAQDPAAGQLVPVQESSMAAMAEPEPAEEEPAAAPAEDGEEENQPKEQPAEQEPQPADEAPVPQSEAAAEVPPAVEPEPVPTPAPQTEPEPVEQAEPEPTPAAPARQTADTPAQSSTPAAEGSDENIPHKENYHGHVYRTPTGECYHYENPCGKGTYYEISWGQIGSLRPCGKCVLH